MEDEMWNLAGEMDRSSLKTLTDNGMTVNEVGKAFRNELDQVGVKLREEWSEKAGPEAKAILQQYYGITGRTPAP
jgi:TRAP-type C4-dicarboxylate transport system substrate-binding protein